MKILIFNTLYAPIKIGGAELSVQSLAEGFVKRGYDVGVVTLGTEYDIDELNGVKIWRLGLQNYFWPFDNTNRTGLEKLKWHLRDINNLSYTNDINEIIRQFIPDIIYTNNLAGFSVSIWIIAKNFNIKVVHTLRDYYLQCPKTTKFKNNKSCTSNCLDCTLFSIKKKLSSSKVDVVIGITKHILNNHINKGYFINAKRMVVYNGFLESSINNSQKTFGGDSYLTLGFIGQINTAKGIGILIKSLEKLNSFKNWELHIAGNVSSDKITELKSKLGDRIQFLGYITPKDFFQKIDILVVPSIWEEPFGRVIIEGLMNKKIVLGSNIGGIPELLTLNRKYLFNPTVDSLVQLLQVIFQNPKYLNDFKFDDQHISQFGLDNIIDQYIVAFSN